MLGTTTRHHLLAAARAGARPTVPARAACHLDCRPRPLRRRLAVAAAAAAAAEDDAAAATAAGAAAPTTAAAAASSSSGGINDPSSSAGFDSNISNINISNGSSTELPPTDGDYWAAALWGNEDDGADGGGASSSFSPNNGNNGNNNNNSQAAMTMAMTPLELKSALLDSFYGTERGLSAGIEARAEIAELIAQLEAASPPPEDAAEALRRLDGEWRLAYTSGSELLAVLALGRLPLVSVGDVTQTIDAARGTFENAAEVSALSGAAGMTRLTATASFEALSARRLRLRFESGGATAPRLSGALPFFDDAAGLLPPSVSVGGQTLDLSPLRPALAPLEEGARAAVALAGSLLAGAPDLRLPVPGAAGGGGVGGFGGAGIGGGGAGTWLVTSYLDEDLRISRGDGGGVFVLQKVAAASSAPPSGGGDGEWEWRRSEEGASAAAAAEAAAVVVVEEVATATEFEAPPGAWSDPASSTR